MQLRHYFWLSTAWWLTGSMGLLSDVMESFVNLAGATFALWMITIAKCPPDKDHPMGHGKAEYFSSGFEGMLIFGAAGAIIYTSALRLFSPQPLEALGLGLGLSLGASLINFFVAIAMRRASVRYRSIALEGGSRHLDDRRLDIRRGHCRSRDCQHHRLALAGCRHSHFGWPAHLVRRMESGPRCGRRLDGFSTSRRVGSRH
jgi:hypothetical protein